MCKLEVMRISRSNLSEVQLAFLFYRNSFGGGAPTGNGDILGEGSELLVVELTEATTSYPSLSQEPYVYTRAYVLFCELDILRSLVADYNIVLGATSLVDVRISTSSELFLYRYVHQ